MNSSDCPLQSGLEGQINGQPQMNQLEIFQQFQKTHNSNMVNQPQYMGAQAQGVNVASNNVFQQQNGGQNPFNMIAQQQEQNQNQPFGGNQMPNMSNSSGPNTMMNNDKMSTQFQIISQDPSGMMQSENTNANQQQQQQQVQAQTALFWNALRASQGQIGNQCQNVFYPEEPKNLQMNMQMLNTAQQRMGNFSQNQPQPQPALRISGGSCGGNTVNCQGFNQNQMNQLQYQINFNQIQQQSNDGTDPSRSLGDNSNHNTTVQQQQPSMPSIGNQDVFAGDLMNQDPSMHQGSMPSANNRNGANQGHHLNAQQLIQNQHISTNSIPTLQRSGGNSNLNGIVNIQNYLKQFQAMQQIQQLAAAGNANAYDGPGPTPAPQFMPCQPQQMMGMIPRQENPSTNSFAKKAATGGSQQQQDTLLQLMDPDPIVSGGKVHAAFFPVGAVSIGNVLPSGQVQGETVNVPVQGICVERGNSGNGRFLDGNFAGGWQSNADIPERKKMMISIINVVKQMRSDTNRFPDDSRLPRMAKNLEEHLYRSAHTRDEYLDLSSLKRRLHLIAKGVGIPNHSIESEHPIGMHVDPNGNMNIQLTLQQNNASHSLGACSQGNTMSKNPQQMFQRIQMQQVMQNQSSNCAITQVPKTRPGVGAPGDSSEEGFSKADKKRQVLQQQHKRLMLLRHSKLCKLQSCTTKFCPQMKILWNHLKLCREKNCPVPHCVSSRCVLSHHRNCKLKNLSDSCEICGHVKTIAQRLGDTSGDDWNDDWDNFSVFETIRGSSVVSSNASNTSEPQADMTRLLSQPQVQLNQPTSVNDRQELLEDIRKKQQVLAQIRSQKENLSGQNQLLTKQLASSQSQENSTLLQNQINLLKHLNSQFECQERFLERDIKNHTQLLQQLGPDQPAPPQAGSMSLKEKPTEQGKPMSKTAAQPKASQCNNDSMPPLPPLSSERKRTASEIKNCDEQAQPKKSCKNENTHLPSTLESGDKDVSQTVSGNSSSSHESQASPSNVPDTASILSSMTPTEIELHLDSLVSGPQLTPRDLSRKFLPIVRRLMRDEHGWVFKDPVDPVELELENYFEIVKNPMCLGAIEKKLINNDYSDIEAFVRDVTLVFNNAILYNGNHNDIGKWAEQLLNTFDEDMKHLMNELRIVSKEDATEACKDDATCSLCGLSRLLYDPPSLFCSGMDCGMQRIRRNIFYYTDQTKQNCWCDRCYHALNEENTIQLDDGKETQKSRLVRLKNDSMPEEQWVQCDDCNEWQHQICALFMAGRGNSSKAFCCPKCIVVKSKRLSEKKPPSSFKDANALPECKLSRAIEDGLSQSLSEEYERIALEKGIVVSEVEKASDLCVRVVVSLEKKHKVREGMLSKYSYKGYPKEFPVTSKCILLFQKIHGVDVLLFGMYVYEYGDQCPPPNRRRVYISYLDSVHYLQPAMYRTLTYQAIICEYLRFVRARGFHTAHIWSCPPSKGDEYIFYCHPSQQLVPKDEMLRDWYVKALKKAQDKGVVIETRTIYDEYFKDNCTNPETGEPFDPTDLPYFDGDYIPGEIEKIINIINKDGSQRDGAKDLNSKANPPKGQKKEGKRKGTRSNPGELINQVRDKVMNRLDLTLARMKNNFFVAQLLSDDYIKAVELGINVSAWTEVAGNALVNESKQIGKNPDILESDGSSPGIQKPSDASNSHVIGNTGDEDPSIEQECLETRISFLNFCQKRHLQFDELRRAKYSTMVLLTELHGPRAEREHQFSVHLQVIAHAVSCSGCTSKNCSLMKQLFNHVKKCEITYRNGCKVCCRLFMLLSKHARNCDAEIGTCEIPFCERIRERHRRLLRQQQVLDDRRRDEQNSRHQDE